MEQTRLLELIDRHLDSRLSPEEAREFSAALAASPEACRVFWTFVEQHAMLSELVAEGAGRRLAESEAPVVLPFRRRNWGRWVACAAAVLIAMGLVWMLPLGHTEGKEAVATLAHLEGDVRLVVGESLQAVVTGQKLGPGAEIQTGEGTAVVAYPDSSRVELTPDTSIRLMGKKGDARKRIMLLKGAVRADVAPQPEGRPMVVRTEQGDLRAPGGRFSSAAMMGETRIELEHGSATLTTPGSERVTPLELGSFAVVSLPRPEVYRSGPRLPRSVPTQVIDEPSGPVASLAVSPDGRTLALPAWNGSVRLWDVKKRAFTRVLVGEGPRALALAFSRDGKKLAVGHEGGRKNATGLVVWDLRQGGPLQRVTSTRRVHSLAWTPDSLTLAYTPADRGRGVAVLDLGDSRERLILNEADPVTSLAISPDGAAAALGCRDGRVSIHDLVTGRPVRVLEGHVRDVQALAYQPKGNLLASGSRDGTIRFWDRATGTPVRVLSAKFGKVGEARSLAFSPDGRTLASGHGGAVVLWDVASGEQQTTLNAHKFAVTALAYLPGGRMLATAGWDRTVKLWELRRTSATAD